MTALDVAELLRRLDAAGVRHVLIGGMAVNAWGVIRGTQDVDVCPDPDPENLERLAVLLRELGVRRLGVEAEGFDAREMPFDPTRATDLVIGSKSPRGRPERLLEPAPGGVEERAHRRPL